MSVKIRLQRGGAAHAPHYRIVVAESRFKRDGRFLEVIGTYNPIAKRRADKCQLKLDRADHWLGLGAQPSGTVKTLINRVRRGFFEIPEPEEPEPVKPAPAPVVDPQPEPAAEETQESPAPEESSEEPEAEAEEPAAEEAEEPSAEEETPEAEESSEEPEAEAEEQSSDEDDSGDKEG